MEDEKAPIGVRMRASENLMERGHGKPIVPQHLHVDGEINHQQDHFAALVSVNREIAERQRLGKSNGVEVIDGDIEPQDTHTIHSDGSEDECADS
jgi:hypothetical protein